MKQRTVLIVAGVIVLAGIIYVLLDTHADVHELTDMVEELLAR